MMSRVGEIGGLSTSNRSTGKPWMAGGGAEYDWPAAGPNRLRHTHLSSYIPVIVVLSTKFVHLDGHPGHDLIGELTFSYVLLAVPPIAGYETVTAGFYETLLAPWGRQGGCGTVLPYPTNMRSPHQDNSCHINTAKPQVEGRNHKSRD